MLAFVGMTTGAIAQITVGAAIEFEKDEHNYGDVPFEGNGTYSFKFTNTGSEPLMISDAKGSCGCTVPSWPKEPIAPGASANIEVTYDTKRVGSISKSVTIMSNAVNTPVKVIRISGNVLAGSEVDQPVPPAQVMAVEKPVPAVEVAAPVKAPLTEKELKAAEKAEKKRLKAEAKAEKKAAKLKLKEEKAALKAKS